MSIQVLPNCIFNKSNPIIIGVRVLEGDLKPGYNLHVVEDQLYVGKVENMEYNYKLLDKAEVGQELCIKVICDENIVVGQNGFKENQIMETSFTNE